MVAVSDSTSCPQCECSAAFLQFQTRTLTEEIFCPRCGYQETTRPIARKAKNGNPVYRTTRRRGYGAYLLKGRNGVGELGALHCPLTTRDVTQFKRDLRHPELDAASSYLARWNPQRRRVEVVAGKFPRHLR